MSLIPYNPIDQYVADWLSAKSAKSGSTKTQKSYTETMAEFRAALAAKTSDPTKPVDLLSDPALVAMTAEQWALSSKTGKTVTPATFNQRLAVVSSFYVFYSKKAVLSGRAIPNPISAVDRHKVKAYSGAQHMDNQEIAKRLKVIDRSIPQGKRDYAMLWMFAITGLRLSEVARLTRADLVLGEKTLVHFKAKGGEQGKKEITGKALAALLDWLHAYYGDLATIPATAPIWVDLSHGAKGQLRGIGIKTVANICKRYIGTSKVHTLRHSFAVAMEKAGATISEIQHQMGHKSAATTSVYLQQLHSSENPHADALDKLFSDD